MTHLIPLSHLPRLIAEESGGPTVTYRQLSKEAVDAQIPVEVVRGRYYAKPTNLSRIAAHFGINLGEAAA